MTRLLYIVTHPITARHLLRGQLAWMRNQGFEVAVATSPGEDLTAVAAQEGVEIFPIPIAREIAPFSDLRTVIALRALIKRWQPDVVNAGTPKAGLLGMLAARSAGVPLRIYTLRGLRLETTRGFKQTILRTTEKIASACAHAVVAVGPSLANRYVQLGLAPPRKVQVLGKGGSNGVQIERFLSPDPRAVRDLQNRPDWKPGAPVVGFVGRFTRDKGIVELIAAMEQVRKTFPETRLLLVGDFETGDPVVEAESFEPLTFKFNQDYKVPLLVHHQCGGGYLSFHLLRRIQFSKTLAVEIKGRLNSIHTDYISVHVRNTDYKTDFYRFFDKINKYNPVFPILICSDDPMIATMAKEFFSPFPVFFVTELPQTKGKPLHQLPSYDNKLELREAMVGSLTDLAALSGGHMFFYTDVKGGFPSGFSILASYLHDNKSLRNSFIRGTKAYFASNSNYNKSIYIVPISRKIRRWFGFRLRFIIQKFWI